MSRPARAHRAPLFANSACLFLAALALSACHPDPDELDPQGLRFEEDAELAFHHVQAISRVEGGISVFWWNVAWGSFNSNHDLEHNLGELIASRARPDLIVLAEYKVDTFTEEFRQQLFLEYPEWAYITYTGDADVGLAIFSPYPMTMTDRADLDWAPPGMAPSDQSAYRTGWDVAAHDEVKFFDRATSRFRWELPGGDVVNLVPVHLLEPWTAYQRRYGAFDTLGEMVGGFQNPLANQVIYLREYLEGLFGKNLDSEPLLLLGDFNVPSTTIHNPPTYRMIAANLEEVFFGNPWTFPSLSSPERGKGPFALGGVKIDHAFINRHLRPLAHAVLPLKGSDHYALYFKMGRR